MAWTWSALLALALATGAALMRSRGRLSRRPTTQQRVDVSVIIPARNEERSLPLLLTSVRELRPPPIEVIVVDDESVDDTARLARVASAHVVTSGPPCSVQRSRNIPSSSDQSILTRPSSLESAPYLTAFVPSS